MTVHVPHVPEPLAAAVRATLDWAAEGAKGAARVARAPEHPGLPAWWGLMTERERALGLAAMAAGVWRPE